VPEGKTARSLRIVTCAVDDSWRELVAKPVYCQKVVRLRRIVLQLLTQLEDVVVDGSSARIVLVAPDFIKPAREGRIVSLRREPSGLRHRCLTLTTNPLARCK
jgi:hypothetical protein